VKRVSKTGIRRQGARNATRELLERIISGNIEIYVGYRQLYAQWCRNNAAVQELRPLFRISGIEPDGRLSVDEGFKAQVLTLAKEIVTKFSN